MSKRVAVLLSGCGVFDGSEIHETVFALLALDNAGAEIICCAPDVEQAHVVNHLTGEPTSERRNALVESARIARGKIKDLREIRASEIDAVIMPGGYGAAKNLSSYATDGANASVHPEVERLLCEMASTRKPIGAICIAPVVLARALQAKNLKVSLTIGNDEQTSQHIQGFGAEHVCCPVREFVIDKENRVVSTPAYMLGKGPSEVFVGIEKLVKAVLEMCEKS
jgi:enhancing lycopene biosynthesis protein 2